VRGRSGRLAAAHEDEADVGNGERAGKIDMLTRNDVLALTATNRSTCLSARFSFHAERVLNSSIIHLPHVLPATVPAIKRKKERKKENE